jgi:formylglycine-generating enzyme required for sulfatase activity
MRVFTLTSLIVLILLSFQKGPKDKPGLPSEYVKIPEGSFMLTPDTTRLSHGSFYMSKFEVSNRQYREFFQEALVHTTRSEIENIACDSAGWSREFTDAEPMKAQYFSNRAFDDYPVVNITHKGATAYCNWLKERIQKANPQFEIEVRLPARSEWIWAAMGGRKQAMFPWAQYYLRNKKGEPMCNFKVVKDQFIHRNRNTGKTEVAEPVGTRTYTSNVKSFTPNDFGLYNMCGNAAEMVLEEGRAVGGSFNDYGGDIHIRAESKFERSSPTIGFRPIIIVKRKNNTGN